MWAEDLLNVISYFLEYLRLHLWPMILSVLETTLCILEKNIYSAVWEWVLYEYQFCQGGLWCCSNYVHMFTFFWSISVNFCLMYLEILLLGTFMFMIMCLPNEMTLLHYQMTLLISGNIFFMKDSYLIPVHLLQPYANSSHV